MKNVMSYLQSQFCYLTQLQIKRVDSDFALQVNKSAGPMKKVCFQLTPKQWLSRHSGEVKLQCILQPCSHNGFSGYEASITMSKKQPFWLWNQRKLVKNTDFRCTWNLPNTQKQQEQCHTTVDHDISDRMLAVGLESGAWGYQTQCLDSPQPQACQDGRSDCSPSIHRPQSPMQTHEQCSL